jgi:hypothetical protein
VSDPETPDPIELYKKVLANVKDAGVTDESQAEELADVISVGLMKDLKLPADGEAASGDGGSADGGSADGETADGGTADGGTAGEGSPAGVDKLEQIAEELREERERLEWAAMQVAHLAERTRSPSIDPDPTPQDLSLAELDVEPPVDGAGVDTAPFRPNGSDVDAPDEDAPDAGELYADAPQAEPVPALAGSVAAESVSNTESGQVLLGPATAGVTPSRRHDVLVVCFFLALVLVALFMWQTGTGR